MDTCYCGCGRPPSPGKRFLVGHNSKGTTHGATIGVSRGGTVDKVYGVWAAMIQRCTNDRHPDFHNYGGRGISVCERWRANFAAFRDDMGPRPDRGWLERDDNDGNYEPGNCRWATRREQQRNRRVSVMVTARGKTQCVADWARETGFGKATLLYRAHVGLSGEEFLAPVKNGPAPCACGCGRVAEGAATCATPSCKVRVWRRRTGRRGGEKPADAV